MGEVTPCPFCSAATARRIYSRRFGGRAWALACCAECGLYFTDPVPSDEEIAGFYTGSYHDELLRPGATEREFGAKFERYASWVQEHVPAGRTLDIGCATGLLPSLLAARGYRAEGVEIDQRAAEWGAAHYGVTIHIEPFDGRYEEAAYDLVSLNDVLEHTRNPLAFLAHVKRCLKPRGHVLVTFPDIRSLESRYLYLLSRLASRDWIWSTCHIPLHVWEFTRETAIACFSRAGFEVAGFRRTQPREPRPGLLGLLTIPIALATFGPASRVTGTQMEFMLRSTT